MQAGRTAAAYLPTEVPRHYLQAQASQYPA